MGPGGEIRVLKKIKIPFQLRQIRVRGIQIDPNLQRKFFSGACLRGPGRPAAFGLHSVLPCAEGAGGLTEGRNSCLLGMAEFVILNVTMSLDPFFMSLSK